MHNKAFLITWEIPRCQQLWAFSYAIRMDPVEPEGESARLTAQWLSSQGPGKGGEGWRMAMKAKQEMSGTPCITSILRWGAWMPPPSQRPDEGGERSLQQTGREF